MNQQKVLEKCKNQLNPETARPKLAKRFSLTGSLGQVSHISHDVRFFVCRSPCIDIYCKASH